VYKFQTSRGPDRDAKGIKGEGNREGDPLPSRLGGLREQRKLPQRGPGQSPGRNEFWRILELEKAHLIDTNLSFLTFLGDLTGRIETPGRPDCGPWAVCWTLLFYLLSSCQKLLESVKI